MTVAENQERTIENQIELISLIEDEFPSLKNKLVAVLQGWEVDEYIFMLDRLKEQGLLTRRIGIGSICRRHQTRKIRKIINEICEELPSKYELHAFGVKFDVLKYKDVWDALESADSLAFRYHIVRGKQPIWLQIKSRIEDWLEKLDYLEKKHKGQLTLEEFEWKNISSKQSGSAEGYSDS